MKGFKEWLSDNLRYILLILALGLLAAMIWIGLRVYQNYDSPTSGDNIEILEEDGRQTEAGTESETETESETTEQSDSEEETSSESEDKTQESDSDNAGQDAGAADEAPDAAALAGITQTPSADGSSSAADENGSTADGSSNTADGTGMDTVQSETAAPQTETQPQTEPEPVYMTLNSACNFRTGPGYDYEVVTSYSAGTTVEFLGMVEGWAEVQIDGMVGYMGRQFLG